MSLVYAYAGSFTWRWNLACVSQFRTCSEWAILVLEAWYLTFD